MSITLTYYVLRHKPTGDTIPYAHGRRGRGGSHVEPCNPEFDRPRLFETARTAKAFLTLWLEGKITVSRGVDQYTGEYDENWHTEPVPTRTRETMEIVAVELALP